MGRRLVIRNHGDRTAAEIRALSVCVKMASFSVSRKNVHEYLAQDKLQKLANVVQDVLVSVSMLTHWSQETGSSMLLNFYSIS